MSIQCYYNVITMASAIYDSIKFIRYNSFCVFSDGFPILGAYSAWWYTHAKFSTRLYEGSNISDGCDRFLAEIISMGLF
jgi:hypothetical protein